MSTPDKTDAAQNGSSKGSTNSNWKQKLIWPGAVLLVAGGMYAWRALSVNALSKTHQEREQMMVERSRTVIDSVRADANLRDARLLGWAIRSEALRNNMEQIEQYLMAYVKEPAVQRVSFIGPDGLVKVSTDGKLLGQAMGLPSAGDGPTTSVAEGRQMTYVPVFGVESQLGTILIEKEPLAIPGSGEVEPKP